MRKFLLNLFRLYFRYFPLRKGKIPVLLLIDKTGLTKNFMIISRYDKNILIKLNLDDWIQKQVFYFGRYEIEKNETLLWHNLIADSQIVIDIGANIGYYTLMSSVRVGTKGKVFSFEPVSTTFKKLSENVKLNQFDNITIENLAVSNAISEIELFVADEKSTGSSSISEHVNFSGIKERVKAITIDHYVKDKAFQRIDVVKIDVEGCEPMVIEGMMDSMRKFRPLVLIEVLDERLKTVGSSKELLYALFDSLDYSAFEILDGRTVEKIESPREGGLIVFKHNSTVFPSQISVSERF